MEIPLRSYGRRLRHDRCDIGLWVKLLCTKMAYSRSKATSWHQHDITISDHFWDVHKDTALIHAYAESDIDDAELAASISRLVLVRGEPSTHNRSCRRASFKKARDPKKGKSSNSPAVSILRKMGPSNGRWFILIYGLWSFFKIGWLYSYTYYTSQPLEIIGVSLHSQMQSNIVNIFGWYSVLEHAQQVLQTSSLPRCRKGGTGGNFGELGLLSSPFFSMRTRLEQTGSTGAGPPPKDQNALEVVQLIGWWYC